MTVQEIKLRKAIDKYNTAMLQIVLSELSCNDTPEGQLAYAVCFDIYASRVGLEAAEDYAETLKVMA